MDSPQIRWPSTFREINDLPEDQKSAIYRSLVPAWMCDMFDIDPVTLAGDTGPLFCLRCPAGSAAIELSLFSPYQPLDPVLYLHIGDTLLSQVAVFMVVVNDPRSPRFDIDVDDAGHPTQLGTLTRNLAEEVRAMAAGLMPGQVRRGLRVFRAAIATFDAFVQRMGHDLYFIEPLFYHNAITFERCGFAYARGAQHMKWIDREFRPGGVLYSRLDSSSPFRQPEAYLSVSGRSWAIHDGIMGSPLDGIQMYRQIGRDAGINTFPDARW